MKTIKAPILASLLLLLAIVLPSYSSGKTTVFTIGDSTMATRDGKDGNLERGWAQMLCKFFTDDVVIENHASCGRSTRSFINEGRWQAVLDRLKPGDYVLIQFGHNDEKPDTALHTEPGGSFDDNLRKFVTETRQKGATPILLNSIVRRNYPPTVDTPHQYTYETEGDVLVDTHGQYVNAPRRVAREMDAAFIDMNALTHDLVSTMGSEESKKLFMWLPAGKYDYYPNGRVDNTHLCDYGATVIAKIAAEELVKVSPELKKHCR